MLDGKRDALRRREELEFDKLQRDLALEQRRKEIKA